jgi:hypothetical protein
MTNPSNSLDVNDDSNVTAGDALAIINYMARHNAAEGEEIGESAMYPDTNGDQTVSARDALRVINNLVEGELVSDTPVTISGTGSAALIGNPAAITDGTSGQLLGLIVDTGRSPRIKFSAVDTLVTVTTPAPEVLDVTFRTSTETNTQRLSIKDGFRLQVIGNDNLVQFDGAIIPDFLHVEIVSGDNNVIQLINSFIGDSFVYRGNGGRDNLILDNGTVIGDNADIHTKKGNDSILVRNVQIGDNFLLFTDDGDDQLDVDGAFVGDDAIVRLGDHNDTARIANARIGDVADIKGGRDFDTLAVDVASVTARKLRFGEFENFG